MKTINLDHASFYLIDQRGHRHEISRSVTHEHPREVHAALGTANEVELQRHLDNCHMGDWFEADGTYKGEDCDGLGVAE